MTDPTLDWTQQISGWLAGTDIELLELRGPGTRLRLKRNGSIRSNGSDDTVQNGTAAGSSAQVVRAGSVGVLLHAHPLRREPLVRPGDAVRAGQALALLQLGAVLLAVAAPRDGVVKRLLAAHGSTVGYGTPLVELE